MKQRKLLLSLVSIFWVFASYAQVYEQVALEDAFGNDASGQTDVIQGGGIGSNLYIKGIAAGSGIRESFLKFSLDDMDNLTPEEVDYAIVELRIYTVRSNIDAGQNQVSVYPVGNEWSETTLTWTNSRELSAAGIEAGAIAAGAGKRIAGYSGSGQQGDANDAYNEENESRFNISAYAIAQYKAGNKTISVMLHVNNTVNNGDQQLASKDVPTTIPGYELKIPKIIVTMPVAAADFSALSFGFETIPVIFTNTSALSTSYAWDFGDGGTSTEENPTHTYAVASDYKVTLIVNGDVTTEVSKMITILPAPDNAPERITGGDLEDPGKWFIAYYNQNPGVIPSNFSLNWDYSQIDNPENFPSGGSGNALIIKDDAGNTGGSFTRFTYVFQPVYLTAGKTYLFDMAARSVRMANTGTLWLEAFVLKEHPIEGKALSVSNSSSIAYYNGSAPGFDTPATTFDVIFSTDSRIIKGTNYPDDKCVFVPDETGVYFCIVRVGTNNRLEVAIDNISLKESDGDVDANPIIQSEKVFIYAGDKVIYTNAGGDSKISIYNITGLLMQSESFANQFISKSLPSGLYIVKVNGQSFKVLLK